MHQPPALETSTQRAGHTGYFSRRARLLIPLCLAGMSAPFLSGLVANEAGRLFWFIDLMTHWQWLFAAGLLATTGIAAATDRRWTVLAPLAAVPLFSAAPELPNGGTTPTLSIASANIHAGTTDPQRLVQWLTAEQPDVVIVLEVSPPAAASLDRLRDYPFRIIQPDDSPFGIALLSKLPFASKAVVPDAAGIPHIQTELMFSQRRIGVAAFHPMPPMSPHYHALRDAQLHAHIQTTTVHAIPAILAGDLNATPWSSAFRGLEQAGWRRATGLLPTWPAWGQGMFGIPIDHVLASSQWRVVERKVGPQLGSDHLPVLVRLALTGDDRDAGTASAWKPIGKAHAADRAVAQ